jgi:capsular exopolysaccharide synthesis family protein
MPLNRQLVPKSRADLPALEPPPIAIRPDDSHRADGLARTWSLLVRRKWFILLGCAAGAAAGIVYSLLQTPVYRARVSMEVQNFRDDFMDMGKVDPTSVNYEADSYVQTQLKLLESDALLGRVASKVPFQDPRAGADGSLHAQIATLLHLPGSDVPFSRQKALSQAAGSLTVRGSGMTRVIEVYADSASPRFAADYLNALADQFIQQSLEARWDSAQHVAEWLTGQLAGVKTKLQSSEDRLNAFSRANGLLITSDQGNVAQQRLTQVQSELLQAQANRVSKESVYETAANSPPEALPQVLDDPTLRDYQVRLADLQKQYADLMAVYTAAHPQVKRVAAQIADLKATIDRRSANILDRIHSEYLEALSREKMLSAMYAGQARVTADMNDKQSQYEMLKREVDTTRQLYDSMLQKVKEAGIASAMRVSNIRVVDRATPPELPVRPDKVLNLVLGCLLGVFAGVVVGSWRDRSRSSLRDPGDAASYLRVPELGSIPSAASDSSVVLAGRRKPEIVTLPGATNGLATALATWQARYSLMAESYRSAVTSILLSGHTANRNVILVTSAGPSEGKTTTTSNLGIVLAEMSAESRQRVVLVDCDMRKPRLHKVFGFEEGPGLYDYLGAPSGMDDAQAGALVRETAIPGLFLLPSGSPDNRNPQAARSQRLGELIESLRRQFTFVLLDSPPMFPFSDARLLARWADAVILVVRSGRTSAESALLASQQLQADGTTILGTILTDWDPRTADSDCGYNRKILESYRSYYGRDDK